MSQALILRRWTNDDRPTLGSISYKGSALCGSVEDRKQPRGVKVPGNTRIPEGAYPLRWRTAGRWAQRFRSMGYPGSLEICEVPDFSDVLIHLGNTKRDTEGCVLPNLLLDFALRTGGKSKAACKVVYDLVHSYDEPWEISIS